jgi:hypothetical protein
MNSTYYTAMFQRRRKTCHETRDFFVEHIIPFTLHKLVCGVDTSIFMVAYIYGFCAVSSQTSLVAVRFFIG